MSLIQGIKSNSSKLISKQFITRVRPKINLKENNASIQGTDNDKIYSTNDDVIQFLNYMIQKSSRLKNLMISNEIILNEQQFYNKSLFQSTCIKTVLKSTLDKMFVQKRLGKNLKGMNKSNMQEIQTQIWNMLERQVSLYQNQKKYIKQRNQLKKQLQLRKKKLLNDLSNLNKNIKEHLDIQNNQQISQNEKKQQIQVQSIQSLQNTKFNSQNSIKPNVETKFIKNHSQYLNKDLDQVQLPYQKSLKINILQKQMILGIKFKSLNDIKC